MDIGDNMERYTFEDLTNERIREYNELDARAKKLENLITVVNDDYKMGFVRYDEFDNGKIIIYYGYNNELKELMHKLKIVREFGGSMRYICPANMIIIRSEDDIKTEYKDDKGNIALTINDLDKFKEEYYAFFDSETYKHLFTFKEKWCENDELFAKDKIRLKIDSAFLKFIHEDKDTLFELCDNRFVTLGADRRTAEENIDLFTHSTFNAEWFAEYVRKNIDSYKGEIKTFAFDDKYKQKKYHSVGFGRYIMEEQFEISENDKKFVLTQVPRG